MILSLAEQFSTSLSSNIIERPLSVVIYLNLELCAATEIKFVPLPQITKKDNN